MINNKISTKHFNLTPDKTKICCVNPSDTIKEWIMHHELDVEIVGIYHNIDISNKNLFSLFEVNQCQYDYLDGFSPNMSKELHVGHLSNFIIAKSISKLLQSQIIVIKNDVPDYQKKYLDKFTYMMNQHDYLFDLITPNKSINIELIPGEGDYINTKVINIDNELKVCIKSDGSTSYLYEDLLMINQLKASTLYITGKEKISHFKLLKKYSDNVNHLPIGHVQIDGMKMGTRLDNVILWDELIDYIANMFNGDKELAYNIIAGKILSCNTISDKQIKMDHISNPKNSPGLYLSYTLARLKKAGIDKLVYNDNIDSISMFCLYKSIDKLSPHYLMNRMVDVCSILNKMYVNKNEYDISNGIVKNDMLMYYNSLLMGFDYLK